LGGTASLQDGVLRLTQATEDQNGYVYINVPFPSNFGVKTSFEYFSYGGTGADGLSMFLFDAGTTGFSTGGFGGSLGYAPKEGQQGLSGAYMGIGFDSFGNFGNSIEGKSGGFQGGGTLPHPNSIVVRGPGQGFVGYEFVAGVKTNEGGALGLPVDQRFPISSGAEGTRRVEDPNEPGYRKVFIDLKPDGQNQGYLLSIEMIFTTQAQNPRMISLMENVPYPYQAPDLLKIGFAASTGGFTNFHEIRNLLVEVSDEDGLQDPVGVDMEDIIVCQGQENLLSLPLEEIQLPNPNSEISCIRFYTDLEDLPDEDQDPCLYGQCKEENEILLVQEGILRDLGESGLFAFTPDADFTEEEVTFYYTITDTYGKTSAGNRLVLELFDAPRPITLLINDLPLEEYNACPGESMTLSLYSEDPIVAYEWYRDGNILEGEEQNEVTVAGEGEYFARVLSAIGCPLTSAPISITYPEFPELEIESPIYVCNPAIFPDLRDYILDLNEEQFDYRITDEAGIAFIGDEIDSIRNEGQYYLSGKPKSVDCWSDPVTFRVTVPDNPLEAKFDYVLEATGYKEESEDGILADDRIRFLDESIGLPRSWKWDFGDGDSSAQRSPSHVFGEKGDFRVTLTVSTSEDCQATYEMVISIRRTYRVMFPTGFTPTRDQNIYFRPKVKGIAAMDLKIFSSWGELLYHSTDLNTDGWDGNLKGAALPPGTYIYRADFETNHGEAVTESGKFLLIR